MKAPVRVLYWSFVLLWGAAEAWGQPFGLSNRVGNTTLRLPGSPPVFGYVLTNAFPGMAVSGPISFASPPDETNRLFILERMGRVTVITNLASPTRTVFMDISARVITGGEEGLLGIAFHPGYATNRYFFLYYSLTTNTAAGSGRHQRLSRFERSPANPAQGMANSELPLFTQRDEASNHNGGDLHFGPDGYLYVTLGDEGNQDDSLNNSQRIDKDFMSGILRLDVDRRPGNLPPTAHASLANATNYFIPADNPFVGATTFNGVAINTNALRAEFWATGQRNPWRMSFDPVTGFLYCGDVGGGLREEINIITKGGNYGWAYREGSINGPKAAQAPAGFSYVRPIQEYAHGNGTNQGNSVTGGVVYRGNRIPELYGWYVFADYVSGNVWRLRYDGTNTIPFQRLLGDAGIVAFGVDPSNGDVLVADLADNSIKRLVYLPVSGGAFPPTLADAGAFTNLATLTPHSGIVPYQVNLPYWSDGAEKWRWHYVPTNRTITWRAAQNWTLPVGSVWIQHFELELTNGVPASRRRLETRFLVRDTGTGVYGITYRWDDAQTNATLVPEAGLDETFTISDGGNLRTQVWHYPSRAECLACHTIQSLGGLALGFNTPQVNGDFTYPNGITDNQIRAMHNAGYFSAAPRVTNIHVLRALADLSDEAVSVEQRVRSYLAANCAQCHLPGGPGSGFFNARIFPALSEVNLVNGALNNNGGDINNRVVVPGSLDRSMLLTRLSTLGPSRMPPNASSVLDTQAIALLQRWITNDLVSYQSFGDWQIEHFGSTNAPAALATADPDLDGAGNFLEWLTHTGPTNAMEAWRISVARAGEEVEIVYSRVANRGFEVQWVPTLGTDAVWQALNVPENRPFFSATNDTARVPDTVTDGPAAFYRVRVFEP